MLLTVLRETWHSVARSYFLLVCPSYIWKGPYSEDLKKKVENLKKEKNGSYRQL